MIALFLTTFLSCSDLVKIANRLANVKMLTPEQKTEILLELKKLDLTCPLNIKSDEQK